MTAEPLNPLVSAPAVPETGTISTYHQTRLKRGIDLVTASLLLLALAPLLALLGILVRVGSPGPALFRQVRVGRFGQPIVIHKFRSMWVGAEDELAALRSRNDGATSPLFKMRDDPRITRVGRLLRRYSLDELPQLINVVTGTMSLVGPRPALPDEVARYDELAPRRLMAKPGMTGLWQVSGRSDLAWHDGIALDLAYVDRASPTLDLLILVRTIPAVLSRRGAY